MYKFLLCWRYLRTRYIALASIVSVTLGVATMIVVNSVMAGFSSEMKNRIHGILSDVVFESHSLEGFYDPQQRMAEIDRIAGEYIEGMTATVNVPSMLSFQYGGNWVTRPVQVIGIDEHSKDKAGDYSKYLLHPGNREKFSFQLKEDGFDIYDRHGGDESQPRKALEHAGMKYRRLKSAWEKATQQQQNPNLIDDSPLEKSVDSAQANNTQLDQPPSDVSSDPTANPFAHKESAMDTFDPAKEQHSGIVLGYALATYRGNDGADHFLVRPGDDVKLTMPTAGTPPRAIDDSFTLVDLYESKMNEYDSSFVFVPIEKLQKLRGMINPQTGIGYATAIQIKLKNPDDGALVRDKLRQSGLFAPGVYGIFTWQDKQGPLLAAVKMETAILNVLLFMIIAVAGFGILATFYMIVVEKTKDIGILKSLGASSSGILTIFLGYGLSLGIVGSGAGVVLGLLIVNNINRIADTLGQLTGQQVFDPTIYYFYEIPTIVDPFTVTWILLGAVLIAVMASVLPASRAASLHPVEALRYE